MKKLIPILLLLSCRNTPTITFEKKTEMVDSIHNLMLPIDGRIGKMADSLKAWPALRYDSVFMDRIEGLQHELDRMGKQVDSLNRLFPHPRRRATVATNKPS